MTSRKKVAVAFSGHLRMYKYTAERFFQLLDKNWDVDFFIHTWDNLGYWTLAPGESTSRYSPRTDPHEVAAIFKPKMLVVENFESMQDRLEMIAAAMPQNPESRPLNLASQCYKIFSVVQCVEEYARMTGTQYDLVIRTRPDILYVEDWPTFDRTGVLYSLYHPSMSGKGTGDMFHCGDMATISRIGRMFFWLERLARTENIVCPHRFVERMCEMENIPLINFFCKKYIYNTPGGQFVEPKPA